MIVHFLISASYFSPLTKNSQLYLSTFNVFALCLFALRRYLAVSLCVFIFASCIFGSARQRTYCSVLARQGSSSPFSQKLNQSSARLVHIFSAPRTPAPLTAHYYCFSYLGLRCPSNHAITRLQKSTWLAYLQSAGECPSPAYFA